LTGENLGLLFPQWQGSGDNLSLYYGSQLIAKEFERVCKLEEVAVSLEKELCVERNIRGYETIIRQMVDTSGLLNERKPKKVLLVGGDCGTEPMPVSYLNKRYDGDLAVIWFDAHGDLNLPEESPSRHFHGMPLRHLLGEGDNLIIEACFSQLSPKQVVLAGGRDLDKAEVNFTEKHNIPVFSAEEAGECDPLVELIKRIGFHNLYIHLDLDVLNPNCFPHVGLPATGGFNLGQLSDCLKALAKSFNLAGYSILEFSPSKPDDIKELKPFIDFGLHFLAE